MYEMTTQIRYTECDNSGRLTTSALINLLQNCSVFHSESVGYSLYDLMKKRTGWFILTWDIKIDEMPRFMQVVKVSTWSAGYKGIQAFRDFAIRDENGCLLVSAHSVWVYMDLAAMLPTRLSAELKEAYGAEEPLPGNWQERKMPIPNSTVPGYHFEVSKLQMDTNGHMNNERYIAAAYALLPEGRRIREIMVEYHKQALLGDFVSVESVEEDDRVSVLLKNDDKIYAVVIFITD